jgi:hypothetical protein
MAMSDRERARRARARRARARRARQRSAEVERRAFGVHEFAKRNNIGKDKVYKEIREGRLKARKAGKRTIIFDTDEDEWRANLPLLELPAA